MLFYLTNSLILGIEDDRLDGVKRCAKYLALAMVEKKHLVRGDFEVLEWLSKIMEGYDSDSVKVYNRLYKRFSTYTIPRCLHYYVKIVLDAPTVSEYVSDNVKIKPIQYSYFKDSSKVQEMPFIGEDTADCIFYSHVGQYYLKEYNLNLILSMRMEKGNGSGIDNATKNYVDRHNPVICIIDSDRKYPGQPIDPISTYAKCDKVWRDLPQHNEIFSFLIVDAQEIENLIPYNYIENLGLWDGQCKKNKEAYDKLYGSSDREVILRYFDLKNGLKKNSEMDSCLEWLAFVVSCYSCFEPNCTDEVIKQMEDKKELCPKLHSSLLKKTNEYIKSRENLSPQLLNFQREEWNRIGSFLLDMCCAGKEDFV